MTVDILAVGAHPDDVELGVGGLVRKLARRGLRVGILDLSRGELSSRGTVEERVDESRRAAEILGVERRVCAGLPDGEICNTQEQQRRVIPFLRELRPRVLVAPMRGDRHPDHAAAHALVRDANYFSGLGRIDGLEPYRAPRVYFYHPYFEEAMPAFIVDITDDFDAKMESLRAHASQFFNPAYEGRQTFISTASFWDSIQVRAAYWGSRAGVRYGEALYADGPVLIDVPPGIEEAR